ncbi:MAG: helix-turn-helix transcriptional regulator [Armatimonadetes bacterium]|nr:helix-turn-helix transcriptional regulator [Armatimonadota bacterium]
MATNFVGSLRSPENDVLIRILRDARQSAGLSQVQLSTMLGQSPTYIVKIERGTRRIDLVEFVRLTEKLGVDAEQLFRLYLTESKGH